MGDAEHACVFVIWDTTITGAKTLLDHLRDPADDDADAAEVARRLYVPGLDGSVKQGRLWGDGVAGPLEQAESVLAFVDKPNVNVGFEIGYALGVGKKVALVTTVAKPSAWLQIPPLQDLLIVTSAKAGKIRSLVLGDDWLQPPAPPATGNDVRLLAPRADVVGDSVHEVMPWAAPPESGWDLDGLTTEFAGVGRVVWALTPPDGETEERDGVENAACAVIAGYAEGRGLDLLVLRHEDFRRIVDVKRKARSFSKVKDALEISKSFVGRDETPAEPAPHDPLVAYRAYLRDIHSRLVPFFPEAATRVLDQVYIELDLDIGAEGGTDAGGGADDDGDVETAPAATSRLARLAFKVVGWAAELFALVGGKQITLRRLMAVPTNSAEHFHGRWVVLGDPGAGKSTLARHLVCELAGEDEGPVPVYVSLPRMAQAERHPFQIAEKDVRSAKGDTAGAGLADVLRERSRTPDGVWLLLDGLDEVSPDDMPRLREQIVGLAADLPEVKVAVFSRPIGYESLGPEYLRARVRPLPEGKRPLLLANWLGHDTAAEVWARLDTVPALKALTGNPLMLTLVASLAMYDKALPTSRVRLYDRAIALLLKHGNGKDAKPVKDVGTARRALQELACVLQESETSAWSEDELQEALWTARENAHELGPRIDAVWGSNAAFLEDVAVNSGVLGPHDGPSEPWRFLHRQFRELLTAERLLRIGPDAYLSKAKEIATDDLPRWSEVFALVCGRAEQPLELLRRLRDVDATLALRALPDVEGESPEAMLTFLTYTKGWRAGDLLALARAWRAGGLARDGIAEHLWTLVTPDRSIEELSIVYWVLEQNDTPPERRRFFEACGRPIDCVPEIDWVSIPAGEFLMGSPDDEPERSDVEGPRHEVRVAAFELAATTVTNEQYKAFDPSHDVEQWEGVEAEELMAHPVVNVSWWQARLYCSWIGARLPSEAEWEYAARAGTTTPFHTGANLTTEQANCDGNRPYAGHQSSEYRQRTVAARMFEPNAWGLHQMHGNVDEWCEDEWHDSYEGAPVDSAAWSGSGSGLRVIRGGSWGYPARGCRSAYRFTRPVGARVSSVGFRPARSVTQ